MSEELKVEFSFDRGLSIEELMTLFGQTEWASQRAAQDVEIMLRNSAVKLGAWRNGRLVAFARALTDDRFRALIDDVVVDATCRGHGVGTQLMERMAKRLAHVDEVFLRCDQDMIPFYERLGYRRSSPCSMDLIRRNEERTG